MIRDPETLVYVLRQRRPRVVVRAFCLLGACILLAVVALWLSQFWTLAALALVLCLRDCLSVARINRKLEELEE